MRGFVIVDLETTGFSAGRGDRIVEVGMVRADVNGNITDTWETLVNPQRHVGATEIHGISARDVVGAPLFEQIADFVDYTLDGSVFVAHNASFDAGFMSAELTSSGRLNGERIPYLDTMKLCRRYLDLPDVQLQTVCRALGLENSHAHSALSDAVATAHLLNFLLKETDARNNSHFVDAISNSDSFHGYRYVPPEQNPSVFTRNNALEARKILETGSWIRNAVSHRDHPEAKEKAQYFKLLDSAFLDRTLTWAEQEQLLNYANEHGFSVAALEAMHHDYLEALILAAQADGVVTQSERATLEIVGKYLGIGPTGTTCCAPDYGNACATSLFTSAIRLAPGDRVAVTGPKNYPRAYWEDYFNKHGVAVAGIAKSTRVVVAGDPNSSSGKAKKARDYGIPVICESAVPDAVCFETPQSAK